MREIVGFRHAAGIFLVLVAGWAWVWVFDRPAQAASCGGGPEIRHETGP